MNSTPKTTGEKDSVNNNAVNPQTIFNLMHEYDARKGHKDLFDMIRFIKCKLEGKQFKEIEFKVDR